MTPDNMSPLCEAIVAVCKDKRNKKGRNAAFLFYQTGISSCRKGLCSRS
jgi:hypothetical protein